MSPRLAPSLAVVALPLLVAACAGGSPTSSTTAPSAAPSTPAGVVTPAPSPGSTTRPSSLPTSSPDAGNVAEPAGPVLSVEPVSALTIRVTLADAAAKAWRLTVAGTGADARSRWDLTVETGDVAPVITTRETVAGAEAEPVEQTALEAGAASGRVCSVAVPVCIRAASVVLPAEGNGTVVLEITRTDTMAPLEVIGATATWVGDPFVLGAWTVTEGFPWAS